MEVGEVPKGIRWSAEAGGPPKVIIGGGQRARPGSHIECAEGDSLYKYILDLTPNCRPGNIVSHNIP